MTLGELWRRLTFIFHRERFREELEEEIRLHQALRAQSHQAAGMTSASAAAKARQQFGNPIAIEETSRAAWGVMWLDSILADIRFAFRGLTRSRAFTSITILSLALALAACTVVFGVIYALNFRPLPYRDAGRLVEMLEFLDRKCAPACVDVVSPETVRFWRERSRAFEVIAAAELMTVRVGNLDNQSSVLAARVGPDFFPVLGPRPVLGRPLLSSDFDGTAESAVVIGQRLWAGRFGSDPGVVGRILRIEGRPHTIVGVLPSEFAFPARAEMWVPRVASAATDSRANLDVVGRLKPGISIDQAALELHRLSEARQREDPGANAGRIGTALSMRDIAGEVGDPFWMLLGAVGVALLIACANVASLFLTRALGRERDLAIRAALGASQWRLIVPSITEGILVALTGTAVGGALALWGRSLAEAIIQRVYNYPLLITLSPLVMGAVFVLALIIGILIGLGPLFHLRHVNLQAALHEGTATSTASRRVGRLRQAFVVAEIAATVVLLTGAGLLAASFLRIKHYDLGYDADHVVAAQLSANEEQAGPREMATIGQQVVHRLQTIPSVSFPMFWGESYPRATKPQVSPSAPFNQAMTLEGRQPDLKMDAVPPFEYDVAGDFFRALRIEIVRGRPFTDTDNASAEPVAIVNEEAARLWWPGEDPLGKRFKRGRADEPGSWVTVVGIAANTHTIGMAGVFGAVENPGYFPLLFRPISQSAAKRGYWVGARSEQPVDQNWAVIREIVKELDPALRVGTPTSLRGMATDFEVFTPVEFNARLLTGLAAFGAFLALVGIYGLVAAVVRSRTKEIGIRLALGARPPAVVGMVVREGARLAMAGSALGLLGAYWLTGILSNQLFRMSPLQPGVLAFVCVGLAGVVLLGTLSAARIATRVDPIQALRAE